MEQRRWGGRGLVGARPDGLQILRQLGERDRREVRPSRGHRVMLADALGDLGHPGQRAVPRVSSSPATKRFRGSAASY